MRGEVHAGMKKAKREEWRLDVRDVCMKGRREGIVWNRIMNNWKKYSAKEEQRSHRDVYFT